MLKTISIVLILLCCVSVSSAYDEYDPGDIVERNVNLPSYYIADYGGTLGAPIRYTFIDHSKEHAQDTYIESIINISDIPYVDLVFAVTHYEWTGTAYTAISEDYWTQTVRCSYTIHDYDFPEAGEYGKKVIYDSPYLESTNYKIIDSYFTELYASGWRPDDLKTNEFSEHPDVLKVDFGTVSNDEGMESTGTAYIDVSSDVTDMYKFGDYGFASSGKGSDGGGGSIYKDINMYGKGGIGMAGGAGDAFNALFFILIPVLFMLAVVRFIGKMF